METIYKPNAFPATPLISMKLWRPESMLPVITVATSLLIAPLDNSHYERETVTMSPFQNQASDGSSILGNQGSTLDSNNNDAFRKLSAIRKLQSGWDTYDGEPPTPESCNVVQAILNASQDYALSVTYVTPTSDGSILLKHEIGGTSVTWEVDGDGEIGMMIERRNNAPIFRSLIDTRIESFIAGLVWNV